MWRSQSQPCSANRHAGWARISVKLAGIEISEITELRDVFPTFLDVLGAWRLATNMLIVNDVLGN